MSLVKFRTLPPNPQQALLDLLPAAVQVDTANKALVLTAAAIEAGKLFCARPLPLGRFEVRARDAVWLEREAGRL